MSLGTEAEPCMLSSGSKFLFYNYMHLSSIAAHQSNKVRISKNASQKERKDKMMGIRKG